MQRASIQPKAIRSCESCSAAHNSRATDVAASKPQHVAYPKPGMKTESVQKSINMDPVELLLRAKHTTRVTPESDPAHVHPPEKPAIACAIAEATVHKCIDTNIQPQPRTNSILKTIDRRHGGSGMACRGPDGLGWRPRLS